MKVVFLIGNGFDLKLGLHTSFNAFLKFYLNEASNTEGAKKVKHLIDDDIDEWKDFELKLGDVTREFKEEEFKEAFTDISDNLRNYVGAESDKLLVNGEEKDQLCKGLSLPLDYLTPASRQRLSSYCYSWELEKWSVDVISFNYTDSIEKILSYKSGMEIGKNLFSRSVILNSIEHIHGKYDGTILLGVNDISQIANEDFRKNQDVTDYLVKPTANQVIGSLIDQNCEVIIQRANLIIIFGSSIGPTDAFWWNLINKRLSQQNARVIIFYYIKNLDISNQRYLLGHYSRKIKSLFMTNRGNIDGNFIDVAINADIFKF